MQHLTLREALGQAMEEEMERDANVFLMGEEVAEYNGAYKVSKGLLEKFGPTRVVDTPISEAGFAGIGIGAAMAGMRPIIEMMTWNFAVQAFDQIINNAAKMLYMSGGQYSVPMVIRGPHGAARMLASQHSQCIDHMLVGIPGIKVVSTCIPKDAKGLLKSAIRDNNPVMFLESELMYGQKGDVPSDPNFLIPLGKAEIKHEGNDVTLVTWNKMTFLALEVAEEYTKKNIHIEVIDLRTLLPMDEDAVFNSVRKTNRLVVLEEGWEVASIGCYIVDRTVRTCFDDLDAPPERVTSAFVPMPYNLSLEQAALPNKSKLIHAIEKILHRKG